MGRFVPQFLGQTSFLCAGMDEQLACQPRAVGVPSESAQVRWLFCFADFRGLTYNFPMRLNRLIWFILAIGVGVAAGLAYGWLVNPLQRSHAAFDSLRADYRADYVLMVAEIYNQEDSAALAAHRLSQLSTKETPTRIVQQAILTGRQLDYSNADLALMGKLAEAMQFWGASGGNP